VERTEGGKKQEDNKINKWKGKSGNERDKDGKRK
jgi:hypothetical protein